MKNPIVFQVSLGENGRDSTVFLNGERLDCVESISVSSGVGLPSRGTLTLVGVAVETVPSQDTAAKQPAPFVPERKDGEWEVTRDGHTYRTTNGDMTGTWTCVTVAPPQAEP